MSGYTPIFNTIFDGTLCGKWPESAVWLTILALCDRHGEVNLSVAAICARTGWPSDLLKRGIDSLMQPDPDSQSPAEEGRRLVLLDPTRNWGWRVVNHEKYREKARLRAKDARRTESGDDAARKKAEREACPPASPGVPRRPAESPSSSSSSSKNSVRAAKPPPTDGTDADQICSLGVQILGESSRSLLGRMVKQYGREIVAAKIGELSAMAPRPVDPKSWLAGCLKPREKRAGRFKTA